jgi:hypothetical protein
LSCLKAANDDIAMVPLSTFFIFRLMNPITLLLRNFI